jgi:hypothetical protein
MITLRNLSGFVVGTAVSLLVARNASAAMIVNCIGEQTTIPGEGFAPAQMWPQQLGTMLGTGYTVNNDGVNGGKVTAVPAATSALSPASLTGPPNIVVIGPFAEHDYAAGITLATWQADYKKLVDAYLALTPAPTIYVMTPPPAAFVYQNGQVEQTFATDVVKPAVLAVAAGDNSAAKKLSVIDLFDDAALVTTADAAGDGHFTAAGMTEVATLAHKCIAMGMCGAGTSTGTGGASGSAGAGGAGGAAGTTGAGGAAGTTGAGGAVGTAGAGGATTGTGGATAGTAGTGGTTTGAAGISGTTGAAGNSGAGTAGSGGTTAGEAGVAGTSTGAAGTGNTATGAAGTGAPARSSSGGGCAVADRSTTGALASLLVAMAVAASARRRRRR